MTMTRMKSSPPVADGVSADAVREKPMPRTSHEAGPDKKAVSELIIKGAEEIQDHLSLVAQIQVKIGRLLEASIEELERAQRLETLTSLIGGGPDKDGVGPDSGPFSEASGERPGAYLEREIRSLKKMQKLLGIRARAGEETGSLPTDFGQAMSPDVGTTEPDATRRILIIYHDPGTVRVLRYFLEKENYEVLACSNGPEGLQKASRQRPDLILLDILLPGLDGYQVLGRLKKDEKTAGIPIFVLSVLAQEADILKALEGGAADYFTKPFSPHIIIAKIGRALRVRHE
jgi:CheY-like chemotaxis protein